MSITGFLLARITEDEAAARAAIDTQAPDDWENPTQTQNHYPADIAFWDRVTPARVLAECAAKRAIVELHRSKSYSIPTRRDDDGIEYWHNHTEFVEVRKDGHFVEHITGAEYLERVGATLNPPAKELLALAAVYADHPAYLDEWRVGA